MGGRSLWRFGGGGTIRSGQSDGLGEPEVLSQTQVLGSSQDDEFMNWNFAVEFAKSSLLPFYSLTFGQSHRISEISARRMVQANQLSGRVCLLRTMSVVGSAKSKRRLMRFTLRVGRLCLRYLGPLWNGNRLHCVLLGLCCRSDRGFGFSPKALNHWCLNPSRAIP
jgi:hypothetical protein